MASCPACGRTLALARATCFYCGAPLAAPVPASATPAAPRPEPAAERASRVLVLLEVEGVAPERLAEALGRSLYDATLLGRRGGVQLVRAAAAEAAAAEAERLRGLGLLALLVPEAEVRAPPLPCLSGERVGEGLRLASATGSLTLAPGEAFLLVSGAIVRERQASAERTRVATARLEDGFRVHVHRRGARPTLEIDALNFECGFAVSGAVRLELLAWLAAVAGDARHDTGFARLPPALAPAGPEPAGALGAMGSLRSPREGAPDGAPLLLDNLAQFRFYSGCLAAVARRREAAAG